MDGNLFNCAIRNKQSRQAGSKQVASGNIINYCKNNNPHQSINKPTDGTGKRNIITYYDRQSQGGIDDDVDLVVDHDDDDGVTEAAAATDDEDDYCEKDDSFNFNSFKHHNLQQTRASRAATEGQQGRPNVVASLPIQVPARRTRGDFNSMKLNMMKVEEEAAALAASAAALNAAASGSKRASSSGAASSAATSDESTSSSTATEDSDSFSPVRRGDRNRPAPFDEDDAFLDREFNENHYNHYVLDGLDDEHLTAEEDPMRLFASIQALAKSLHEDAELFGSLPPKRLLESPIRSIAFVCGERGGKTASARAALTVGQVID